MSQYEIVRLSSLAKVFPDRIYGPSYTDEIVCRGEELCLQLAVKANEESPSELTVSVNSDFETALYRVGYVPSEFPAYPTSKCKRYLTKKPGLFPDPMFPLENGVFPVQSTEWTSLFVTVQIPKGCVAGRKSLVLTLASQTEIVDRISFSYEVLDAVLPPQATEFTQWLHADCVANVHGVKVFSEKHWKLLESYLRLAGKYGITSVLTPVFTPPLDTAVGGERTTVQLVGIVKDGDRYQFDFSLLKRFASLARKCGIHKLEIAHLFTQWGAAATPKIVAKVNGKNKKIFGWNVPAMSDAYRNFLTQFLPALIEALESYGYNKDSVVFHISDEPNETHLEAYRAAVDLVEPLVGDYPIIDALSKIDFYQHGLVKHPVVALCHIRYFLKASVPNLWGYYCCAQGEGVSNRFMSMPASRNRIIGLQCYKYDIKGFLHWGYNFYYTRFSKAKIDPYKVTDAGREFPSGDAFSVYPYKDGAIPSIRLPIFYHALNDIRLCTLLEEKIGREATVALIDKLCGKELTFYQYPTDGKVFMRLRREAAKILK